MHLKGEGRRLGAGPSSPPWGSGLCDLPGGLESKQVMLTMTVIPQQLVFSPRRVLGALLCG